MPPTLTHEFANQVNDCGHELDCDRNQENDF